MFERNLINATTIERLKFPDTKILTVLYSDQHVHFKHTVNFIGICQASSEASLHELKNKNVCEHKPDHNFDEKKKRIVTSLHQNPCIDI